jgi:hypothetical protein
VAELFATGRIVDLILGLVVLETIGLLAVRRRTGRGVSAADLLPNLLAGACLLLAVRAALTDAGWTTVAACLLAALGAHGADLRRRWR